MATQKSVLINQLVEGLEGSKFRGSLQLHFSPEGKAHAVHLHQHLTLAELANADPLVVLPLAKKPEG